ncbi:hypothetical protein PQR67_14830 [Paraburkholderia fungorum]
MALLRSACGGAAAEFEECFVNVSATFEADALTGVLVRIVMAT